MAQGIIKEPEHKFPYVPSPHNKIYIEGTKSVNINAYSYYDLQYSKATLGYTGVIIGQTVMCDRNERIIVSNVSSHNGGYTFRFYNPTNATQASKGLIIIMIDYY